MAKSKRHNPEQIIRKLAEADRRLNAGQSIAQVCQALEVSEATFHRWRNQFGGMKAQEAKRLKELEKENACAGGPDNLFVWVAKQQDAQPGSSARA